LNYATTQGAAHGRSPHQRPVADTSRAHRDAATVTHAGGVADPTRFAHPRRIADSRRITANGDELMTISAESVTHPDAASAGDARLPFDGYDRLNAEKVVKGLSDHSQVELEAVESYERSHKDREPVLNKLRYMRGSEPFSGYDALSVDEILAALEEADMETIKKVRAYERKFANRALVLEEVARVHQARRAAQPASAPPAYTPTSYE
jgi:hypothetical protein